MQTQKRFTIIDGLRGIAALMVVVFHLQLTVEHIFIDKAPSIINSVFKLGHWGIEIFFVISGFVITYSIRKGQWSFSYLARFGLRRSIRLDPPYWIVIAIEVSLIYISLYFFPELGTELPNIKQLSAHLLYLQEFLGLGHLLPIFWTLCYEVQFYLVLVGSLTIYSSLRRKSKINPAIIVTIFIALIIASYIYSLATFLNFLSPSLSGLFIDRWYQFLLGALAWWSASSHGSRKIFILTWLFTLITLYFSNDTDSYRIESTVVILITSMLVYLAYISGNHTRWLNNPVILFLGTISYSLYLVHLPIGWRLIALGKKIIGDDMSLLTASLILLSGILISIFSAWLIHKAIERPSINLAHRVKLNKISS